MKAAMFYAIKNPRFGTTRIVAVTSIKRERNWYGRELPDNMATHGSLRDLYGKFETPEDAQAKIAELNAIRDKHRPLISKANLALNAAHRAERDEIETALPRCHVSSLARILPDV